MGKADVKKLPVKDLIHPLSNDFVHYLSVPGSVLGPEATWMNKRNEGPALRKVTF